MNAMTKCKGCGKLIIIGKWCTSCYNEYHESKEELMAEDQEKESDEDDDI